MAVPKKGGVRGGVYNESVSTTHVTSSSLYSHDINKAATVSSLAYGGEHYA